MSRCARCGTENEPDIFFCRECGHFLSWSDAPPSSGSVSPSAAGGSVKPRVVPTPDSDPVRPSAVHATSPPPPPPPAAPAPKLVQEIIAAIDAGREIASSQGRTDLDQHLHETRERLAAEQVQVVFCGQFKVGKITMINALLQRAVCPVDADVVTAVPTIVRYADKPPGHHVRPDRGRRPDRGARAAARTIDLLVTEEADPSDPSGVGLRGRPAAPDAASGLAMVDTPGVGGLDSAHGFLTLGALRYAKGVVFVTDAAQELTGPELAFLKTAVERCPRRRGRGDQDRSLSALAADRRADPSTWPTPDCDLPIIAVSSFLRLRRRQGPRAQRRVRLRRAGGVPGPRRGRQGPGAARQDARPSRWTSSPASSSSSPRPSGPCIDAPQSTEQVVKELDRVQEQAKRLIHPTATWQQTLSDGIQDLVADVEHDLQARLRTVIHDVEEVIDSGDPKDTWNDTEVWLRRQIAIVTVANRDLLTERAEQLAQDVADHFELPEGTSSCCRWPERRHRVGRPRPRVHPGDARRQARTAAGGGPQQLLPADDAGHGRRQRDGSAAS